MTCIVDVQFSELEQMILVRIGALAVNLIAEKVVDGVAKLLVKGDVEAMKGKNKMKATLECEAMLQRAKCIAEKLYNDGAIDITQFDELFGSALTRAVLTLTGKGRIGPEKKRVLA